MSSVSSPWISWITIEMIFLLAMVRRISFSLSLGSGAPGPFAAVLLAGGATGGGVTGARFNDVATWAPEQEASASVTLGGMHASSADAGLGPAASAARAAGRTASRDRLDMTMPPGRATAGVARRLRPMHAVRKGVDGRATEAERLWPVRGSAIRPRIRGWLGWDSLRS